MIQSCNMLNERECSCRWRFADRQRCSSQALRSRESIVERTDGSSGRRKIMIKACGIDVQGTFPRACHIVLPYETYVRLISVISEGERCNVLICVSVIVSVSNCVCVHMHTCVCACGQIRGGVSEWLVWMSEGACTPVYLPFCNYLTPYGEWMKG